MRPMQDLGELLTESDRLDESIAVYERMLGLNPGDNQGIRYALLGLYLAAWRGEQAAELMKRYPGEEDHAATFAWSTFAWGRVLLHWPAGCEADARSALLRARRVNPFAESYLTGMEPIPERLPPGYRPGDPSAAQFAATGLSSACEALPQFTAWLRRRQ